MTVTVYGLRSSITGRIKYVGQTSQPLERRLKSHIAHALAHRSRAHCAAWIRQVLSAGGEVFIFEIEANAVRNDAERRLIAWYRKHGAILTNISPGGDGNAGPRSVEHAKAISGALKGKPKSDEHRAKLSASLKGKQLPAALIEAVRLGLNHRRGYKRRPQTADALRKISEANTGRKHSPETIEKMSAARAAYWSNRKSANV